MAFFADLGGIDYFPVADPSALRAIGWLARGHEFPRGEVSREFFDRLCALLASPWEPLASGGSHSCELCRFSGGPAEIRWGHTVVAMGASNLFVPGAGVIYVAPSSICLLYTSDAADE